MLNKIEKSKSKIEEYKYFLNGNILHLEDIENLLNIIKYEGKTEQNKDSIKELLESIDSTYINHAYKIKTDEEMIVFLKEEIKLTKQRIRKYKNKIKKEMQNLMILEGDCIKF